MASDDNSSQVLVGGKILIKMDQKIVGFANRAECSDSYGLQPIHVMGQLHPVDYVPSDARHTINMNVLVLKRASLIQSNLEPAASGSFGLLKATNAISGTNFQGIEKDLGTSVEYGTEGSPGSVQGALRVLHGKSFAIEIIAPDIDNPELNQFTVVRYRNCFYNSGSVSFSANTITMHNCQFFALYREGWLTGNRTSFKPSSVRGGGGGGGGGAGNQLL